MGQFIDEGSDGEVLLDMADRTQPADPRMGLGTANFQLQIGHVVGQIGMSHFGFKARRPVGSLGKRGTDARVGHALQPRHRTPVLAHRRFTVNRRNGVIIVVLQIVFAGPKHMDGPFQLARQQGRLDTIIGLALAPKPEPSRVTSTSTRSLGIRRAGPTDCCTACGFCVAART